MKEGEKSAVEEASRNKECSFGRHRWLWASISLLVLGQVTSFIYLIQSQQSMQHLVDSYNSGLKCFCRQDSDERSFTSTATSSIGEADLPERNYVATGALSHATSARKKRSSSSNKTQRHSNKVSWSKRTISCVLLMKDEVVFGKMKNSLVIIFIAPCFFRKPVANLVRTNTTRLRLHLWE